VTENLLAQDAAGKLVSGDDGRSRDEQIRALFLDKLAGEQVAIRVESLKDETVPAMVLTSEQGRRRQEMARFLGDGQERQVGERTLLINTANPVIRNLMALHQQGRAAETEQLVAQVYDLAMLSCQAFDRERMERFLERSHQLLARIEPGGKVG
jgi:molecular chaperone HtpG